MAGTRHNRVRRGVRWLAALAVVAGMAGVPRGASAADDVAAEVEALLKRSDDLFRGVSSHAVMEMQVKTERYTRAMKMETWAKGTENTLVRILEPAKDAGVATLKVGDNLWNYLPKVDRTMKVPAGMMSGAWMGSHFTNDDLVQESRLSDDFTFEVAERPSGGQGRWVVQLVPKPDAPVVWGRVEHEIGADDLPVATRYYDEKGALVRTMTFEEVGDLGGRRIPRVMRLTPADKPEESTVVRYVSLDLDANVADSMFSLQALKR